MNAGHKMRSRRSIRIERDSPTWKDFLVSNLVTLSLAILTYLLPVLSTAISDTLGNVVAVLSTTVITILIVIYNPITYVSYLLYLVLGQASLMGGLLGIFSVDSSFVVTEIKTISVVVAFFAFSAQIVRMALRAPIVSAAITIYFTVLVLSIRTIDAGTLAYARNFVIPLLIAIVFAAATRKISATGRALYFEKLIFVTVLLLFAGNAAELIVGSETWRHLLNADSQQSLGSLSTETSLFGVDFSRAGGIMVEPVTSGYLAGATLVGGILLASRRDVRARQKLWVFATIVLGSLFVLITAATKASLLMVAVAAFAILVSRILRSKRSYIVVVSSWGVSMFAILGYMYMTKGSEKVLAVWSNPIGLIGGDSTPIHLAGLIYGIKFAITEFWGAGLGVGGNFARFFDDEPGRPKYEEWLASGSESAVGVLAYQTGMLGLISFILVVIFLSRQWGAEATVILSVWSATALMAESMFGPLVALIFMAGASLLRTEFVPGPVDIALMKRYPSGVMRFADG